MKICAVILAGGKGTRMHSDIPKAIYPYKTKPMITYIIDALRKSLINDICVVTGYQKEKIIDVLQDQVVYTYQPIINGTASALLATKPYFQNKKGYMIILPADMPLIDDLVIKQLISTNKKNLDDITIVTTYQDNPYGYGRIIRKNKKIIEIKEEKDANQQEKQIKEINSGIYMIKIKLIEKALTKINCHNKQNEYYLTDIIKILNQYKISSCLIKDSHKLIGINDINTLKKLEENI